MVSISKLVYQGGNGMTLTQIRYVVEIVNSGSISKAAANLFISQPVISTAISNLEKEVGAAIFIRKSSGVTLTPFGKAFVPYMTSIQEQIDQLNRTIVQKNSHHPMTLSVSSISFPFTVRAIIALTEQWGKIGLRIEHYDEDELGVINQVASHIAEIGILRTWSCYKSAVLKQLQAQNIQYFPLADFKIGITLGPHNPLYYSSDDYVQLSDLKDYPMIFYRSTDTGPYSDIIKKLGLPYTKSRIVTTSRAAIAEILAQTDAYMLDTHIPNRESLRGIGFDTRRNLLIKDTQITSEISWIKHAHTPLSPIASDFINLITSYFSD